MDITNMINEYEKMLKEQKEKTLYLSEQITSLEKVNNLQINLFAEIDNYTSLISKCINLQQNITDHTKGINESIHSRNKNEKLINLPQKNTMDNIQNNTTPYEKMLIIK